MQIYEFWMRFAYVIGKFTFKTFTEKKIEDWILLSSGPSVRISIYYETIGHFKFSYITDILCMIMFLEDYYKKFNEQKYINMKEVAKMTKKKSNILLKKLQ